MGAWKTNTGSFSTLSQKITSRSAASSSRDGADQLERENSYGILEASNAMALLKASPPTPVGTIKGRYSIRIKRATLRQPFGLAFQATEGAVDSRLGGFSGITIAEELPH